MNEVPAHITNWHHEPSAGMDDDRLPVIMVWHGPTMEWYGLAAKDALAGADPRDPDVPVYARWSQRTVETMLASPLIATEVMFHASRRGVAIIDWMKPDAATGV